MRKQYDHQYERNKQFSEILREKKIKFQKDQKVFDRILKKRLKDSDGKNKSIINPQRLSLQANDIIKPRHQQSSEIEQDIQQQSNQSSAYLSQVVPQMQDIRRQYLLRQKAQNFIQRLKKQKEYNKGKFLLIRKKEQQKKQAENIKMEAIRRQLQQSINRKRKEKIISNIMLHEQRISFREDESMLKQMRKSNVRSKTQNTNKYDNIVQSHQFKRQLLPIVNHKRNSSNESSFAD